MNTSEVQLKLLGQCSHELPGDDAGWLRLHVHNIQIGRDIKSFLLVGNLRVIIC